MINNQKGVIPVALLLAAVGLITFIVISSSSSFKDKLFSQLFPKRSSYAVSGPISPTPTPDTILPTVSITNPLNGTTVRRNTTVVITAKASDNIAVSKVEVYVAGSLKCSIATPNTFGQYNCSWNVPKQTRVTYQITAKAYDSSNNTSQNSISVTSR